MCLSPLLPKVCVCVCVCVDYERPICVTGTKYATDKQRRVVAFGSFSKLLNCSQLRRQLMNLFKSENIELLNVGL